MVTTMTNILIDICLTDIYPNYLDFTSTIWHQDSQSYGPFKNAIKNSLFLAF